MRLTSKERSDLKTMIETHTFFGIPIEEIDQEIMEMIDTNEARVLYIVASMLGWEVRDKESFDQYPYEAEEYLKKFTLKK